MPPWLPPLPLLRLFESAGRHQSFKLAAQELGVTPSAVSHGVNSLEKWLDVDLFTRSPRGISLTPAGKDYLPYIADALSVIAAGTRRMPRRREERHVRISCAPTFAIRLLIPALSVFRRQHPTITVSIDTSHTHVTLPNENVDLAIRMAREPSPTLPATRILAERLVPVCSPSYLRSPASHKSEDRFLARTLLHVTTVAEDWSTWLQAAGQSTIDPRAGLRFDEIHLAFGAAAAGLGVAIGRRPLVDPELHSGVLVPADELVVASTTSYWLIGPSPGNDRPAVASFRQWLIAQMSEAATAPEPRVK
jgi:LysR family transcriptional regulator, glycine cleavage system transcriptional activator